MKFISTEFSPLTRRATLDLVSWKDWPRAQLAFLMVDDNLYQCLQSEIQSHIIARKQFATFKCLLHKLCES